MLRNSWVKDHKACSLSSKERNVVYTHTCTNERGGRERVDGRATERENTKASGVNH